MSNSEVAITYQTLFELSRRENSREDLQKLEMSFYKDVAQYVKEKRASIISQRSKEDLFAAEESKKTAIEFDSIKKIIRKLYEKRESKIINMALDSSRTDSAVVDTSAMIPEEKELYHSILKELDAYRLGLLCKILDGKDCEVVKKIQEANEKAVLSSIPKANISETSKITSSTQAIEATNTLSETNTESSNELFDESSPLNPSQAQAVELIRVAFKESMPQFVGDDFNEYGPFEPGDSAELPPGITEILVNKNVVERV